MQENKQARKGKGRNELLKQSIVMPFYFVDNHALTLALSRRERGFAGKEDGGGAVEMGEGNTYTLARTM